MTETTIEVSEDFISYRSKTAKLYNQRGRTDKKFLMDLDCEIVEHHMMQEGIWYEHPLWQIDAITNDGHAIDCKFISKYWNISRDRALNLFRQNGLVSYYYFYEWITRPRRPLEVGDTVSFRLLGCLDYRKVTFNLKKSYKEPDGFYIDVRKLLDE